ncbi:MAG: ChrR family anti-sigma-E factor [Alphaproteobacteria bacterium]
MNAIMDHNDLMLDYASGALAEGPSLVIASKLAMGESSRSEYREIEAIAGALFETIDPSEVSDTLLDETLARLDADDEPIAIPAPIQHDEATCAVVPHPLRQYLAADLDGLNWVARGPGLEQCEVPLADKSFKASLLRIRAGEKMPRHTHKGIEYTLVLAGGFSDESGHYGRGGLAVCDGDVDHSPVADWGEDCICLTVLDAPIKMTGLIGMFVNPFVRF